ncbi:hypothetical protein SRHO_G00082500 [Serrasalmus rhombeus]
MISDGIAGSSRTLSRMAKCLRNVCKNSMASFIRDKGQRVGGRTEFTVIDESHFRHKRKYGRGRAGQTWRRKKWVFGILGVRGQTRRPVLRLVEHRSRRALLPLVRRHVRQGSTIISDEWRAYRAIKETRYRKRRGKTHYSSPAQTLHTQLATRCCLLTITALLLLLHSHVNLHQLDFSTAESLQMSLETSGHVVKVAEGGQY